MLLQIELTRAILSPRLSDFLRNSTIHFPPCFCYLVTCCLKVMVSLLYMPATNWIRDTCFNLSLYIYLIIVKRDEIVRSCDRHSNEAVTLRKHVTKYKNIRKWIVEFLRKSESRRDKIARVNSIFASPYQWIYFNFVKCWGPLWCRHFLTNHPCACSPFMENSMDRYMVIFNHLIGISNVALLSCSDLTRRHIIILVQDYEIYS